MDEIAYTTVQSSEYTDAKEFISKIDFAECYDIPNLDPELKSDLQAVENFVSTHTHYTMEEIATSITEANKAAAKRREEQAKAAESAKTASENE